MKYTLENCGDGLRLVAEDGIPSIGVEPGERGGIVDSPDVLSQEGSCWIDEGCTVKGGAVAGSSRVKGGAAVTGCLLLDTEVDGGTYHGCTLASCRLCQCHLTDCRFSLVHLERYRTGNSSCLHDGYGEWTHLVVPACEMPAALGVPDEGPFSEAAYDVPICICGTELLLGPVPARTLPLADAMVRRAVTRPLVTCDCEGRTIPIRFEAVRPGSVSGDDDLRHKSSYAVYAVTLAAESAEALKGTPGYNEAFPDGWAVAGAAEDAYGVHSSHPGRVSWRRLGIWFRGDAKGVAKLAGAAAESGWDAEVFDGGRELHLRHPHPESDSFHVDTQRLFRRFDDDRRSVGA